MSGTINWLRNEKFQFGFLLGLAALIRVYFLIINSNTLGDAAGNVVESLRILGNPGLRANFDPGCSTLYNYAVACFMLFWRDPVLAPKVFTVIFGVLLILPFYGTIKVLFHSRIAFISSLILVFYPLHIVQSSATTSDAIYYFFVFISFYYLLKFIKIDGGHHGLLLAALFFNIASLLRFECWLFMPFLFFMVWIKEKATAIKFFLLLLIGPCCYLLLCQIYFHNAFISFQGAAEKATADITAGNSLYDASFWSWMSVLWRTSGPFIVAGGLSGMLLAVCRRQARSLAVFFLVGLLMLSVSSYLGRLLQFSRYSILCGLLLIPYAVFLIDTLASYFIGKRYVALLLCLILPAMDFLSIARDPDHLGPTMISDDLSPVDRKVIAGWLKNNVLQTTGLILIDDDTHHVFMQDIILLSGISLSRYVFDGSSGFFMTSRYDQDLKRDVVDGRFEYLVLHSKGPSLKFLHFDINQKNFRLENIVLEVVFEKALGNGAKYLIYKVTLLSQNFRR